MEQGCEESPGGKKWTRFNLQILGVSEMRWPGSGKCHIQGHTVYYSGSSSGQHENGVGIILNKAIGSCVINFILISERVMTTQVDMVLTLFKYIPHS